MNFSRPDIIVPPLKRPRPYRLVPPGDVTSGTASQASAARISAAISQRIALASIAALSAGHLNCLNCPRARSSSARPYAPHRRQDDGPDPLLTTNRNRASSTGMSNTSTSSCPSSTPILNASSDTAGGIRRTAASRAGEREAEAVNETERERDHPAPLHSRLRRCSRAPCRRWRSRSAFRSAAETRARQARGCRPTRSA